MTGGLDGFGHCLDKALVASEIVIENRFQLFLRRFEHLCDLFPMYFSTFSDFFLPECFHVVPPTGFPMESHEQIPSGYDKNGSPWLSHGPDFEIDGLPFLKTSGSFHGKLLVITRWYIN